MVSSKEFVLFHKDMNWNQPDAFYKNYIGITDTDASCNLPEVIRIERSGLTDTRVTGELPIWTRIYDELHKWEGEYATLHHYRRKFENYYGHICLAKPIIFGCSLRTQVEIFHGKIPARMIDEVISDEERQYYEKNVFYPYNIMSVNKCMLYRWLEFITPKIKYLSEQYKLFDYDSVMKFVKENAEDFLTGGPSKDCRPEYQSRLFAFIVERLSTIFWRHFNGQYNCEVKLLQEGQTI